jgi:hypothetical protein
MTTNGLLRFSRSVRQLDGVALAIALTLLVLMLLVPAQMVASLHFTLDGLWRVAPFLLLSIAIAAYAQASGADNLIAKAFQGRIGVMVPIAAMFGAFSPFCSCGVIPLIAALLSMGVPVAAVMAFWLASPLMDPSMFVLTVGTLGLKFALFKTVATVAIGLLGGFGTLALMRFGPLVPAFATPLREGVGNGGCGGSRVRNPKPVAWAFWSQPERRQKFWQGAAKNTWFLGKWLAPGIFARESDGGLCAQWLDSGDRRGWQCAVHLRGSAGGHSRLSQWLRGLTVGEWANSAGHGTGGGHDIFAGGRRNQYPRHDCCICPGPSARVSGLSGVCLCGGGGCRYRL